MRFSESFIQRVRDSSDIVKIVGEYVQLKRRGRNYLGLCPFHNEKTPSFNVSPETGLYHCFGCSAGGNVFTFIMEIENLNFTEAVQYLAEKAGIPVEYEGSDREQQARRQAQRRLSELLELVGKYYSHLLKSAPEASIAREYIRRRGISAAAATSFGLGFAKADWDDLITVFQSRGYSDSELVKAGLVLPRKNGNGYYDRFRERLIFPIKDHQGRIVAFAGRKLTDAAPGPKYLNSPETEIFTKGAHLYGLDLAKAYLRKGEPAIITEGYMDVISLHSAGFQTAVASMGTALTVEQARLLSRFCSQVLIAYDGDAAGTTATWRGLETLAGHGLEVKVIVLPAGQDPDSFIRTEGAEAFRKAMAEALPLTDYKLSKTITGFNLERHDERVKAARAVLPILAELNGAVAREAYLNVTAGMIGISVGALRRELDYYEAKLRNVSQGKRNIFPQTRNNITATGQDRSIVESQTRPLSEVAMLKLLLAKPELLGRQFTTAELKFFTDPVIKQIIEAMLESASTGQLDPAAVVDRLAEAEAKKLLTDLIFSKELAGFVENPHDCMAKVRKHYFQEELKDLTHKLINIRNTGQVAEIKQLTLNYINLYQEAWQTFGERGDGRWPS